MAGAVAEWTQQLREYVAKCRTVNPLPGRDQLSDAQEWQCRILGGSILSWLRQYGPRFLQERAVMCKLLGIDRDPAIVFTSNVPGLVAAREIIGPHHERVLYLLEDEFAGSSPKGADPQYKWHVHFWSFFREQLDPEFAAEARVKHPIPAGCSYWQHTEGTMWAANAGLGGDHLWQWNGQEPELLEEAMRRWVS